MKRFRWIWVLFLLTIPVMSVQGDDKSSDQPTQLFLAKANGNVYVIHSDQRHSANPPEALVESDRIKTGSDGKAYLEFQNGGVVEVGPNSDAKVSKLQVTGDDFKARFLLAWGRLKAKVKKLTSSHSSFEVEAGGVVAGVRGTVFGVEYDHDTHQVSAQTFDGTIFTTHDGKEEILEKGFAMAVNKTGISVKSPLTGQQMSSFKDFVDVSGQLEQKKQELLNDLHNKVMNALPNPVQEHKNDIEKAIGQKLPF